MMSSRRRARERRHTRLTDRRELRPDQRVASGASSNPAIESCPGSAIPFCRATETSRCSGVVITREDGGGRRRRLQESCSAQSEPVRELEIADFDQGASSIATLAACISSWNPR